MKELTENSTIAAIFLILALVLTFTLDTTKSTRGIIALIFLGLCLIYYFIYHYYKKEKRKEKIWNAQ